MYTIAIMAVVVVVVVVIVIVALLLLLLLFAALCENQRIWNLPTLHFEVCAVGEVARLYWVSAVLYASKWAYNFIIIKPQQHKHRLNLLHSCLGIEKKKKASGRGTEKERERVWLLWEVFVLDKYIRQRRSNSKWKHLAQFTSGYDSHMSVFENV